LKFPNTIRRGTHWFRNAFIVNGFHLKFASCLEVFKPQRDKNGN
jgi:hypothetical protein